MPVRRITVVDVAQTAGVSAATVSNFFNNPARLSASTRERVARAVEQLQYVPNGVAMRLRTGRTPIVAYIAFELAAGRTPEIAAAMERAVARRGHHLVMVDVEGDADREHSYLELFDSQRVSGIIISPIGNVEPVLAELRQRGTPSIMSARRAERPDQPSVSIDHVLGGRLVARHLLDQGHRRLAYVTTRPRIQQLQDRIAGARHVVEAKRGATMDVLYVEERTVSAGVAAAHRFLQSSEPRATAVMCANDLLGIGFVQGLQASSLRVPEDVAVTGYDDLPFSASNGVPLTSVRTPHSVLGAVAVDLLFAMMNRHSPATRPDHLVFRPELVIRTSSRRRWL